MGNLFEILYIPPKALEVPEGPAKPYGGHHPTGSYKYICEKVRPDGSFEYLQEGLTIPNIGEREYKGLLPGQCMCCYYRSREILEWTSSGPGYLALMTPGWYQEEDGTWRWWHGDAAHGRPGCSCRNYYDIEDPENLEDLAAENLEAQHAIEDEDPEDLETQPASRTSSGEAPAA